MEFTFNIKDSTRLPVGPRQKETIVWYSNMEFYTNEDMKRIWSEEYGRITTISFMVYGDLGKRDNLSINYAIRDGIENKKFAQVLERIDFDTAELYDLHQT